MHKSVKIIGATVGGVFLIGVGSAIGSAGSVSSTSGTSNTVTKTAIATNVATEIVNVRVTETPAPVRVETNTVPQVCLDALSEGEAVMVSAGNMMQLFSDFTRLMPDALTAAYNWDTDGLNAATAKVSDINTKVAAQNDILSSSNYRALADACRASK